MNYYALETQMWDKQREMLRGADMRRLAAIAREQPAGESAHAPRVGVLAAVANALRSMVAPGGTARIEHPGLSDAS